MIKVYNLEDLNRELNKNKTVLALFYSTWCPYCIRFLPVFNKKASNTRIKDIVHVILDDYDDPIWDVYSIPAVPTIILFDNGQVCKRLDARLGRGLSEERFLEWIEEFNSQ